MNYGLSVSLDLILLISIAGLIDCPIPNVAWLIYGVSYVDVESSCWLYFMKVLVVQVLVGAWVVMGERCPWGYLLGDYGFYDGEGGGGNDDVVLGLRLDDG